MAPTSNSPGAVTSGGPSAETSDRQSNGSNKKKKKKSTSASITSFVGKCADIKDHVYDVGGNRSGFDLFVKTTREIAEYVGGKLKDASEFRNAMDPDNLVFETLTAPTLGDAPTVMDIEIWKIAYKGHSEAINRRELLVGQVFAIVLGQCSPTVVDRLKASANWATVNNGNDLMGLLRLIRTSMYTGATSKNPIQSLLEAQTKFLSFRQGSRMSNAEYLRNFTALSDQVIHLHGEIGTDQAYVTMRMQEDGDDPDDVDSRATMTLTIREEYLAMLFFTHADSKRFGSLVANAQNDFVGGVDKYPKTVNKAYDMLVNFVNPNKSYSIDDQDAGMSFYQEGRNSGRGGNNRNNAGGRGGGATRNNGSGGGTPDDDNHANVEDQEAGSASNNSTDVNAYSEVSFNISSVEQVVLVHTLPRMWLLLDSCSTTDIFANSSLLTDVHEATTPIWVRCNAGRIRLTQQGYFGNYPHPVWYNPKGVANILSLANVTKYYRVTMDSTTSPSMTVHRNDNSTIQFEPSGNGLYKHELPSDTTAVSTMWCMLTNSVPTVSDIASNYSKRAYQRAVEARRLQNIIMRPASKKYKEVILDYLRDAKVSRADIDAAEHIFGPNVGSLRGKTVRRPNPHVPSGVDAVPHDVLTMHKHVTLTIDLMFINNLPFFVSKSRDLQFTTVEFMKNRQVPTVHDNLKSVIKLYTSRGFIIDTIFADHEFEVLRPWHPNLNTAAANEHVPDIERHIRTIKDTTRSTYRTLPFRRLPRIALIHLVKNAVFWLNAVPTNDGITRRFSPRYIMTGQRILASKHAVIPFGAYVQTHEEHNNDMGQRTLSCICLGPTGNTQGGHWFMSLTSGEKLIRHRWTELPMPREAITRVNNIGKQQKMPTMLTYSNRYGAELPETVDDYPSDTDTDDSDDDTYSQPDDSDEDSVFSADTDASDDSSTTSDDSDTSHDDGDAPLPPPPPPPPYVNNYPFAAAAAANQGVWAPGMENEFAPHQAAEEDDFHPEPEDDASAEDPVNDNDSVETPADEEDEDEGVSDFENNETTNEDGNEEIMTESDLFRVAETHGRAQATQPNLTRPRRNIRAHRYEDFNYAFFEHMRNSVGKSVTDREFVHSYVTAQMSAKKGLKVFAEEGAGALMKELRQVVVMDVMSGCHARELTREQKKRALRYLMFLKQKRCGLIKGRGCVDGRPQRLWKNKQDTTSPTLMIESLFLSCVMDAYEQRDVATIDIPSAFMQAFIDELVHIKFDDEIIDLLCDVDPSLKQYVTYENGKRVLYTKLNKALYGTLQASRLFWERLSSFLIDMNGFERNPYDFCVVNKVVNGKQLTIVWYVDDLKISHEDSNVVTDVIEILKAEFGKQSALTVRRGKIHDYLGIKFDFSKAGKVVMTMADYISELIEETPDDLFKGTPTSPAGNYLMNVNPDCKRLDSETAVMYHHLTVKLLYLAKRVRPDLQTAVSFLCTRVQNPDEDDWKKLGRCLTFLRNTKDDPFTLAADGSCAIRWWVDASYAVHPDMKSHTGATMSLGQGCVYSMSCKQKLNTRSSTEAELVAVNDAMSKILWTRLFLEAQGYTISDNVVYQDNQSAILLENNGKLSSSKRTRHIEIRFFFVTDHVKKKNIRIEYCPTDDMLGDFYTKPTQGTKFRNFRRRAMGMTESASQDTHSVDNPVRKECVGDCDSRVKFDSDESGLNTSWIDVVSRKRKKKTDVVMTTGLGGEPSGKLEKLTLFTKSKLVKQ